MRVALLALSLLLTVANAATAQKPVPEGYFHASDIPKKVFYITAVQPIPDTRWDSPNYLAGFAKEKGWDTKKVSWYTGSLHYISKASAFFEKQDRESYLKRIDRMKGVGYTIVTIPMPKPISLDLKAASAIEK